MSMALVVREDYWNKQFEICAKLIGIDIDHRTIEHMKAIITDYVETISKCLRNFVEVLVEVFNKVIVIIKDKISSVLEDILELFKVCDNSRLENRMLYTFNWQNCIRQEKYYKTQFKLNKVNYNIMNHDRRC